ncbi:hypothetical protein KM043_018666 [Ampulex compressa]|nr:hypothetical protein KM043_018666 [Ampulex compressa]
MRCIEPKFLRELKEKAGYKEGPTVDTKREALPEDSDDERDTAVEQPVVVVLKPGDLTAEEADAFQKQKEQEEANAPADLSKRIIFRKGKLNNASTEEVDKPVKKRSKKAKREKVVLSFDDENDEDNNT